MHDDQGIAAATAALEAARATVADLEAKLSESRSSLVEIEARLNDVSLPAHTGDEHARKGLDRLSRERATLFGTIDGLERAIASARKQVEVAKAAAQDAVDRDKAQRALAMLDAFQGRAVRLQASLEAFIAEYERLVDDFGKLDLLGYRPTSYPLVALNMKNAVATALQFTDLRMDFLAPKDRRQFVDVIAGWASAIRTRASARLKAQRRAA